MDYTDLLKDIIYNQQVLYGCLCLFLLAGLCHYLGCITWSIVSYFKKRRLAKITRKNLDKLNEIDGTNQDNVND